MLIAKIERDLPCAITCSAYQTRMAGSSRRSSSVRFWPQGNRAATRCTICWFGHAAANARMYFRFLHEKPSMSGNASRREGASTGVTARRRAAAPALRQGQRKLPNSLDHVRNFRPRGSASSAARDLGDRITKLLAEFKLSSAAEQMTKRFLDAGCAQALVVLAEVLEVEWQARRERRVDRSS